MARHSGWVVGILVLAAVVVHVRTEAADPPQREVAEHVAPGVISTPEHGCLTFAPDGRTLLLTKRDPARGKSFIAVSRLVDGRWTAPEIAPFSGEYSEGDPAMAPDGSRLVFWSSRPLRGGSGNLPHLWFVERAGDGWGQPRPVVGGAAGPLFGMGPTVAGDGSIYFLRGGPDAGGPPWLSRMRYQDGRYGPPEYLDASINGVFGGGDSAVAPDERFLVFSSVRPDGAGSGDLYVSLQHAGRWTEPRNLGSGVNSRENEYCPALSPDGKTLYFTRAGEGILRTSLAAVGLDVGHPAGR